MPSAGELLRSERLKKGRTLAEIAEKTCISKRYLEALEADSVKDLPGEFFYKAFLRQYAEALELDAADTGRILSVAVPASEPDPVPRLSQVYERAHAGEPDRWRPSTGAAIGILVAVIAGGSITYAWWQRSQSPPDTVAADAPQPSATKQPPSAPASSQPRAEAPPTPSETETVSAQPPAAPTQSPAEAPVPAPAVVAAGQSVVELVATEPAWVQVSSEGKTLYIGTLQPGEPRQIPTGTTATLRTGNAGAVSARWNGQPVGEIGPKGQVRTVRFSPEGAQVATPQPKNVSAVPEAQP